MAATTSVSYTTKYVIDVQFHPGENEFPEEFSHGDYWSYESDLNFKQWALLDCDASAPGFVGSMDEFGAWNKVLTPSEIEAL